MIYKRIINIFENYLKIKYNKDNKDIKIYKHNDILMIYYNEQDIITLYSLFCYSIKKMINILIMNIIINIYIYVIVIIKIIKL